MHAKKCLSALSLAALALVFAGAHMAIAADCLPPACTPGESVDGGVPDGVFESNTTEAMPAPSVAHAPKVAVADDPGSAIFNPFTGGREAQEKVRTSRMARLLDGDPALMLTIGVILALALAAIGAFFFSRRKAS